jgi:cation diffusion facilitator family transporter
MASQPISERQQTGQLTGVVGLIVNFLLFAGKLLAGLMSNSIAIMADAFNNLTDCGSSLATIVGFRFSARKGDELHPHGHGRIEYVAGLVIAIVIIVTAFGVGEAAFRRIFTPETIEVSMAAIVICLVSIAVKLALAWYIRHSNRQVESQTLKASMIDSLSDTFATAIALLSLVLAPVMNWPIDGYLGMVVALFILYAGIRAVAANINLLLGQGLSSQECRAIIKTITSYQAFKKVDQLDTHDYGPEARIILARVRLGITPHIQQFQDEMQQCKAELKENFGFTEAIFYWPPTVHHKK